MPRRARSTPTVQSLLDAWQPPENAGNPVGVLASTFEFDASLYERELLPRFLGCAHDAFDDELLFMIEREHRLMSVHAAVLVDSAHVSGARTSPRWDQIAVRVLGGCLHAKVCVLAWENVVRLIVSSANLTPGGYRLNHEIAYSLDFEDSEASPPRSVLHAFLSALERYSSLSRGADRATQRFASCLSTIRAICRRWKGMPIEFSPRAAVQIVPVFVEPGGRLKYFDAVQAAIGTTKFETCWVMSPFWDDPASDVASPDDPAALALRDLLRVRSAQVTIIARGALAGDGKRIVQAPERVRATLARSVGAEDVFVAPVVLRPGDREGDRRLHAKGLWLYDSGYRVLVAGSSNFTAPGTGLDRRRCNVEANLAILVREGEGEYELINELGPPQEEPVPASEAQWTGAPKEGEGADSTEACAPPFLVAATWRAQSRELAMTLLEEPAAGLPWKLGLLEEGQAEALWSDASRKTGTISHAVTLEKIGASGPAALRLEWVRAGETSFARVPVTIEDPALLPAVDAMRPLTVDELLNFFVSGADAWSVIHRLEQATTTDSRELDALDPHKLVDTSQYVTTRTRRFSQALAAIRARLLEERFSTLDGLRSRLFGPLGPWSLALAVAAEAGFGSAEAGSPAMPGELAVFFLTELALILRWSPPPSMHDPALRGPADAEWAQLRRSLDELISSSLSTTQVGRYLESYSERVRRVRPAESP